MKRALVLVLTLLASAAFAQDLPNGGLIQLPGMLQRGSVTREANGIPHVFALNKHDLYFLNGWVHAQDRLFEMDFNRRAAYGTLSELLGSPALYEDVQLRTLGLGRAAAATLPTLGADARAALDAYAAGVNAYVASHPLPPEYGLLEITHFQPWTATDSIGVGKVIAFGLSFDTDDINRTAALLTYQGTGKVVGFDGTKLFFETWRSQPFSNAATIPDATGGLGAVGPNRRGLHAAQHLSTDWLDADGVARVQRWADSLRSGLVMAYAAGGPEHRAGSNEWAIAPKNSASGAAMVANDPHLALQTPANFYPIALQSGHTKVAGMSFPGAPFVIQGQNERIAWGSTVFPVDVTDIYQEQLVPDASSPSGLSSIYKGAKEPVIPIPQSFKVNVIGDGINDNLIPASANATPPVTLIVSRHGPIVTAPDPKTGIAYSVQYVGLYPTHELESFMLIDDAQNVNDFKSALQLFDVGAQNFAVADVDGNIAYFTGGEVPVREDLQAGTVNGVPPFFIRNGQGGNEWMAVKNAQPQQALPYEILPYAEMPQVVNPTNGWFVNANNDPLGQTLDNDPLNQLRPGGGIFYLAPGYDGIRAGRITQIVRQKLANGGKISYADMQAIQSDTVLLDAEVFVPFITKALTNSQASADPTLKALGSSPVVQAVISRLSNWDFSTPTGLPNGYDSHRNGGLSAQTPANSVAATLYAAWRSKFLANTIDTPMKAANMPPAPDQQALTTLRFHLENFSTTNGIGASGVSFFNVPGVTDPATRRDILILKSVADGMTMLSGDAFKAAFNKSTNLDDYQWGKLHRIEFDHVTGLGFLSPGVLLPPFPTVPGLPGVSVDGGFSTVDAASHSARASSINEFMFAHGPNRRYVGEMTPAIHGESSLPGGVSGNPASPLYSNLLLQWLTNDTFPVVNALQPDIPWLP